MTIQCTCGKFQAEINQFPSASPGRCVCYCDDCQCFAHYLGHPEFLDNEGGTEIIPVYPSNYHVLTGKEFIQCMRLSPKGLMRWYTSCCKTPVGNQSPGLPWIGLSSTVFRKTSPDGLERIMGKVASRIQGKFARGQTPPGTSETMTFKDFLVVAPFLIKGFILNKAKASPFQKEDHKTLVTEPTIISKDERNKLLEKIKLN